ncbi:MAG: ABC transporter substrate-binding protein [Desulfobacteraceae bacterium]|nr:MAG: ABC transporter substrate-binding protein [Desulfobacteraceae bacterium]
MSSVCTRSGNTSFRIHLTGAYRDEVLVDIHDGTGLAIERTMDERMNVLMRDAKRKEVVKMKRRSIFQYLLVLVLVFGALNQVQAADTPKSGGVLRVADTASPPTLDFMCSTSTATRVVGTHIFEGLMAYDKNYQVVPMLAENYEVGADGKTFVFRLRKGVLFHNGDEMKAEDVKACVDRFIAVSPRKRDLADLESVNVIDDYTIEFKLKKPIGPFLGILANPVALLAIMPKEAVEGKPLNKADIIGTGPYQLVEWIPDRHVKIKRFKDYKPLDTPGSGYAGKKGAYLDEINFVPVTEPGARVAGLEAGDYDFADFLPGTNVPDLKAEPRLAVKPLMPFTWPVMYFNFKRIFKDIKMRQAVQAGLDLESIMIAGSEGEGSGRLDPGLYFKEQVWHSDIGKQYYNQNDKEKARRLMKDAGYKGEEIIVVTNTSYEYMYKSAIVVEQELKEMGFNVKLVVLDWPGALALRKDLSKWDMFFSSHSIRFDPFINNFYFLPETTFFAYDNPEMAKWIRKGMDSVRFEERKEAYDQIQRIFYEDAVMIKLYDLGIWQGWQKHVKGYEPWYMLQFLNTWVEK